MATVPLRRQLVSLACPGAAVNGRQKRLLIAAGLLGLALLALALAFFFLPKTVRSGPLTLPDGSVVRIVAVTYGTNHVVGPPLWRALAQLPPSSQKLLGRWPRLGNLIASVRTTRTTDPTLIVWVEGITNRATALSVSSFEVFLADESGFISGSSAWLTGWWFNPAELRFQALPRRGRIINLKFFFHKPDGTYQPCGSLAFANPVFGKFTQWQPESLPSTKRAGEVAVTLQTFSTGHDNNNPSYKSLDGARGEIEFGTNRLYRNQNVCFIHMSSITDTNQVWRMVGAELSDATGNHLQSTSTTWGGASEDYFAFEPGLWSDENAWKLKCEIKRTKGFAPEELLTFKDVPLGRLQATNHVGWTTNLNGVSVTIDFISRRLPETNDTWSSGKMSDAHFLVSGMTNGLLLDLLSVRANMGTKLEFPSWSSSGSEQNYYIKNIPVEATNADFTFAVHHSCTVEFMVRPEVGPARLVFTNQP
jgi:hypothetical protein